MVLEALQMARSKRIDFPPRGLSQTQDAVYVGVSTSLFDQMVADGRMGVPASRHRPQLILKSKLRKALLELNRSMRICIRCLRCEKPPDR